MKKAKAHADARKVGARRTAGLEMRVAE